jgi:hypothetical protein
MKTRKTTFALNCAEHATRTESLPLRTVKRVWKILCIPQKVIYTAVNNAERDTFLSRVWLPASPPRRERDLKRGCKFSSAIKPRERERAFAIKAAIVKFSSTCTILILICPRGPALRPCYIILGAHLPALQLPRQG